MPWLLRPGHGQLKGFDMLVLSRKAGESIVVGDDVEVQVIDIHGGRVRLGITVPEEVAVHRSEV